MVGFLNTLLGGDDNMPARPSKADFPLRDAGDPRVLYTLSQRAKRISLKVKPSAREVHVVVPGLRAFPKAREFAKQQRDWIDVQLEAQSWISVSVKYRCAIRKAVGAAVSRGTVRDIFPILGVSFARRRKSSNMWQRMNARI